MTVVVLAAAHPVSCTPPHNQQQKQKYSTMSEWRPKSAPSRGDESRTGREHQIESRHARADANLNRHHSIRPARSYLSATQTQCRSVSLTRCVHTHSVDPPDRASPPGLYHRPTQTVSYHALDPTSRAVSVVGMRPVVCTIGISRPVLVLVLERVREPAPALLSELV